MAKSGSELRMEQGMQNEEIVCILGAGPAGLLAAHAAALADRKPIIYSAPNESDPLQFGQVTMSDVHGATYLHVPIPEICDPAQPHGLINYIKWGTRGGYAQKVYGDPEAPCSWDQWEEGKRPAWSLAAVYMKLWERYSQFIIPMKVNAEMVEELLVSYALVISTIPAPAICLKPAEDHEHQFTSQDMWVQDKAVWMTPNDTIIYSGREEDDWYRSSVIFGTEVTEYTELPCITGKGPPIRSGVKPLSTNCDCWSDRNLLRAGRFGQWEKGVLAHHAFEKVFTEMFNYFEGT